MRRLEKNSKFRKPGGSLFSTQAYFEMQVLSLPCKEKKFTWIFFLYNEKNFPQKTIDFTVWLFSSNKSSSTKQSVNQLI